MKKHFTISLRLGFSLLLVVGPLMSSFSARNKESAVTRRIESRRPVVPKRYPIGKKEVSKARAGQDIAKVVVGRSSTLLADGRWLMTGGEGDLMATAAIVDSQTGESITLAGKLLHPRMGHTATMLPDGNVLILGGIGPQGQYVASAEIFNTETQRFETHKATGLSLRANHTTTLLTDGQLLIAGGTEEKGKLTTKVEILDIRKNTSSLLRARLQAGRQNHTALLQADGTVVFSGGTGENGETRQDDDLYDPEAQSLTATPRRTARDNRNTPQLQFSAPNNGALEIDEDTQIVLRFSKSLSVKTLNRTSVVLQGPLGDVATRVVPAESGMLAFITPLERLHANSQYNLTVNGASDESGQGLPFVALTFKTKQCRNGDANCGSPSQLFDTDTWIPDARNLKGDWRSGRPDSSARSLPALQAAPGETALAGQVMTLSGNPLAGVTLQINDTTATTDFTGRFLLRGLEPGKKVLTIQGHTASRPGKTYATFDVLVDVAAGKTTALSYTIWLPVLDEQNAVRLPVPTSREMAVTTPRVPGMEVRVPSDAVLRLPSGKHHMHGMMKRELESVSITPIPIDRPPFPLPPGVDQGLLFTLQLHGAKVEGLNGEKRPGLRIVFPNIANLPAGTRVNFWNYESEEAGWYIYGQGTVSPDARQVVPDPGVELQSMHCVSLMDIFGPVLGPIIGHYLFGGDPVDLGTGLFIHHQTDLAIPDVIPLLLSRTYRQNDTATRSFGKGATNPYDMYVVGNTATHGSIVLPDGGRVLFNRIPNTPGYQYEHTASPTQFYKATMKLVADVGPNGHWEVRLTNGTIYQFGVKVIWGNIFGPQTSTTGLSAIQDRLGNRITILRDNDFRVTKVISPRGRWINFTYSDTSEKISQVTDNAGRTVSYTYDANGRLWKVTDVNGGITEYTYDSADRMLTIKDQRGIVYLTNQYDANGRVYRQTMSDTGVFQFAYTLDGSGKITQTDLTNPRGYIRRATFNSDGYPISDTYALGTSVQQSHTYTREAGTNRVLSTTDPLGRTTTMSYNSLGQIVSITTLAGTSEATTSTIAYEPIFNQVSGRTDPLNHTVSYSYDVRGNLASVTNALGHKSTYKYNASSELTSSADPLGNTTRFSYNAGNPVETIDPMGRINRQVFDSVGRLIKAISPIGQVARFTFDNHDNLIQVTDPLEAVTEYDYDENGNLLSVTDARDNVAVSFIYDSLDRITTRRDPLEHDATFEYDLNGNLKKATDRKSQATNYTYDALDRLTQITYADSSTTTYTYDAANRTTQIVDSVSGTITYGYDNFDRLTSETTPQGSISYTYDAAGRLSSMTVAGQAAVNYTYDDANRITQITQGSATVSFTYDNAGRRTSLTLPNGVITEYSYDASSLLTAITYRHGTNVLGNLTYEYDDNGRRTRVGGSFANSVTPSTLTSATYNAANQQVTFGSQSLTYDLNGNVVGDGANTYSWDARNRLASISGSGLTASFQYDALGRRIGRTINGNTTSFLYNGANTVQEQSTLTGTANILPGQVDEIFTRTDSAGTFSPLQDALGSALFLTDASGALQSQYVYGAFGSTAVTGPGNTNDRQYTGRENDDTGLYFNRNRYYSPVTQRFISEDPIGLAGGINAYAYVENDPISFTDAFGTSKDYGFLILAHGSQVSAGFGDLISGGLVRGAAGSLTMGCPVCPEIPIPDGWSPTGALRDLTPGGGAVDPSSASYAVGEGLGIGWEAGMIVASGGAALASRGGGSGMVTVSRWGREGLQAGDWVVKGPLSRFNYFRSFKWQPGMGNQYAPYSSGTQHVVPASSIRWPQGWGIDGWWKGLFGQRRYMP